MKQEDKQLLLKDLCARLPYGVKCKISIKHSPIRIKNCVLDCYWLTKVRSDFYEIKPYLFPLSSMTEEQKEEYYSLSDDVTIKPIPGRLGMKIHCIKLGISDNPHEGVWDYVDLDAIDWLNKNHFDYRGLISMGLANDANGLNIY